MLISALCDYYDILLAKKLVVPDGYTKTNIGYIVALDGQGHIAEILDYRQKVEVVSGKNTKIRYIDRACTFPRRESKTAVNSELLDHRAEYIFGLQINRSKNNTNYFSLADAKHSKFIEKNVSFIEGIDDPLVNAYRLFLHNWDPENELNNDKLKELSGDYSKGFAFCLQGRPDKMLQDNEHIIKRWESMLASEGEQLDNVAQCAVTGEMLPIARIHSQITGIKGAQSSGAVIVSFKNKSEESYGKEQSYNSNISVKSMKKYTEAFRYLVGNNNHHSIIDELHLVHWAVNGEEEYDNLLNLFMTADKLDAEDTETYIKKLISRMNSGVTSKPIDLSDDIDPGVTFYIVGFKPNAARLSFKFIYRQQFGNIVNNVYQHVCDMKLCEEDKVIPLWKIKEELISPKSSSEAVDPSLMTRILESILYGSTYPYELLSVLLRRVRIDSDIGYGSTNIRMRMIKAIINRNRRKNNKEEIEMALNRESKDPAYLCGRLFYVLENVQRKASVGNLNRTIKDSYFSAASLRPASTFPKLLRLSQYHLRKITGSSSYREGEITEILDLLEQKFPTTLNLEEQGIFMLGYYQQKAETEKLIKQYMNEQNSVEGK